MLRKNLVLAALASVMAVGANAAWEQNQSLAGVYDYKIGDQVVGQWLGVPFMKESSSYAGVAPAATMMFAWESHKLGQSLVLSPSNVHSFIMNAKQFNASEISQLSPNALPTVNSIYTLPARYFNNMNVLKEDSVAKLEQAIQRDASISSDRIVSERGINSDVSIDSERDINTTSEKASTSTATTATGNHRATLNLGSDSLIFDETTIQQMEKIVDVATQQQLNDLQNEINVLTREIRDLQIKPSLTSTESVQLNNLTQQFEIKKVDLRNLQVSVLKQLRTIGFYTGRLNTVLKYQDRYLTPVEFKQIQQKMFDQVAQNNGLAIDSQLKERKFDNINNAISFIKDNMEKTMSPVVLVGNVKDADERIRYLLATGSVYCPATVCSTEVAGLFINDSAYGSYSISASDNARKLALSPRTYVSQNELNAYWKPSGSALPWMRQHTFLYNAKNETVSGETGVTASF